MNTSVFKRILFFSIIMCCVVGKALANNYNASMTANISSSSPTGAGTVYVNNKTGKQTESTTTQGGSVSFTLKATANTGYEFINWSDTDGGTSTSTDNPWKTNVYASNTDGGTNDYVRYAVFKALDKYYFKVSAIPSTGGTASAVLTGMDNGNNTDAGWKYGQHWDSTSATASATFTATPAEHYGFLGWSTTEGGTTYVNTNATYDKIDVTSSSKNESSPTQTTLYANFKQYPKFYFNITAQTDGNGTVTTSPSPLPTEVESRNVNSTSESVNVTFIANPKTGYGLVNWTDADGTVLGTDVTLTKPFTSDKTDPNNPAAYTVKANFSALTKFYYKVLTNVSTNYADGSEDESKHVVGGSVSGAASGSVFGAKPSSTDATASVTLTATANKGYAFKGWYTTADATGTALSTNATYTYSFTTSKKTADDPEIKTLYACFEEFPIFYAKVNIVCKEWKYDNGGTTGSFVSESQGCVVKSSPAIKEGLVALHATSMTQASAETTIELTALPSEAFGFRGWGKPGVGVIAATAIDDLANSYSSTRRNDNYNVTATAKTRAEAQSQTALTIYAYFKELPLLYFQGKAEVLPCDGTDLPQDKATPNPAGVITRHATSFTELKGTTSVQYTAADIPNYKFGGWYKKNTDGTYTQLSTYNPYSAQIESTSADPSNPTVTTIYAKYLTSMTKISIEANDIVLNTEDDGWLDINVEPDDALESYIITAEDPSLLFVDNFGHVLTNTKTGKSQIYIQGVKVNGETPESLKITVNATVKVRCKTPEIAFEPNASNSGETAVVTLTTQEIMKAGSSTEKVMPDIFYSTNNTDFAKYDPANKPTIGISQTLYAYSMVTKADGTEDTENYSRSEIVPMPYNKPQVATPTINITSDGVTFTCDTEGVTYYYIVNDAKGGTNPTTETGYYTGTWTSGTAISTIANEKWIKVIAVKSGYDDSEVAEQQYIYASGVHGKTVYLNDYEDHNWTYYSGVDSNVDGGNYNTNYAGKIYSPNPRNVKITYKGNGGEVSIEESETEFVYYKTIEKNPVEKWLGTEDYPYQVISNPFSRRPKVSDKIQGFAGWKIVSGGEHIKEYANEAVIPLDAIIHFVNLDDNYTPNCTSAKIELQATWVDANVQYGGANINANAFKNGTYETNLLVINANYTSALAPSYPVTIMMVEPDGSGDYRQRSFSGGITPADLHDIGKTTKIEWAQWTTSSDINAQGRNFTIGRGITRNANSNVYGTNTKVAVNQIFKVESGKYSTFCHYGVAPSSITKQVVVFGNDYDRARKYDNKLDITGSKSTNCHISSGVTYGLDSKTMMTYLYSKSGKIMSSIDVGPASTDNVYYFGPDGSDRNYSGGCRYLNIQGGEWCCIAGGFDNFHDADDIAFTFRMSGGTLRGSIYGAGEFYGANGCRAYVITGGTIKGWVAAGANGTQSSGGEDIGTSYVYVGGNSRVDSKGNNTKINKAVGGNVFGAGCGYSSTSSSGEMRNGTNVVIADNAYVERGVYGGGGYGFTTATSNIYVTGGEVGGVYEGTVPGGVYGGAQQNKGGNVNIYMTGGKVLGGVFGGSNSAGTLSGSVTMQINGGQVGTEKTPASIHGGGYGTSTQVSGDVDITLGQMGVDPAVTPGVTVYGNVYGGSALGKVNGSNGATSAIVTTRHTNVTVNSGSVFREKYPETAGVYKYGYVFGGGMGDGSNNNGIVDGLINVVINSTDPAPTGSLNKYALYGVFGGGDAAPYNGTPNLTVNNCGNSIEYVYGGGNKASVSGSNVQIHGGNVIGNVFGGGNAANVTGNVHINIEGGTILNVFGGNNASGTVSGNIVLNVNQRDYTSSSCPINIGYLYGGGNRADSKVATMNIYYANNIDYVFGGAKAANMTGNINLNIVAGNIGTVFGGNDSGGAIDGKINVKVNWDQSENKKITFDDGTTFPAVTFLRENNSLKDVYGGGNVANYGTATKPGEIEVKVLNADMTGNVFGGGKEATVTGTTEVTIGDWNPDHLVYIKKDVYGGGDQAGVTKGTTVTVNDCSTFIEGDVYGGGNAAPVGTATAPAGTNVTIWGGSINKVFGGGHGYPEYTPPVGADIYGDTNVNIYGGTIQEAFGGSNSVGNITGKANITLDQRMCEEPDEEGYRQQDACSMSLQEVYGAGNQAKMVGEPNLTILCVDELGEVYGGARAADIDRDIVLNISSGKYRKVFGGNNVSGKINGTITVNVDETGCHPVVIGELYGGGNQAEYEAPEGKQSPVVNVISCTSIGTVFGGGYGRGALVTGSPYVNIDMVEGDWSNRIQQNTPEHPWNNKLGTIGTVFGGGNAANVEGNTNVSIGTKTDIKRINGEELPMQGVNIKGNVYGGGNAADVTGSTHVVVGKKK